MAILALNHAPNALAGVVTGIGFIGGRLTFRQTLASGKVVHGITTAAAIFAAAGIGATAGQGRTTLAVAGTILVHRGRLTLAESRRLRRTVRFLPVGTAGTVTQAVVNGANADANTRFNESLTPPHAPCSESRFLRW